jgi:hypothetical protein
MKKILILVVALCATFTLSAQTYKVGDIYDVNGKKGVVFEVSADGNHGKILSSELVSDKVTWNQAMEWGSQLKDGWYLPSIEEMNAILKVCDVVFAKMPKARGFFWTTTEYNRDCAWFGAIRGASRGALYKGNKFYAKPISKF